MPPKNAQRIKERQSAFLVSCALSQTVFFQTDPAQQGKAASADRQIFGPQEPIQPIPTGMLIHEVSIPEKSLRDRYNLFVVNLFQMLPLVVAAQPTGICSLHQNDTVQHQRAVRPPVENDISRLQRAAVSGCELHPAAALLQKRPHTGAGNR